MAALRCRACGTPMTPDQPSVESWEERETLCPDCVAALLQPIQARADDPDEDDRAPWE